MSVENGLSIQKVYSSVVNYAMQQNHVPVIRQLILRNDSDIDLQNIQIEITSQPEFALPFHTTIDSLPARKAVNLGAIDLLLSGSYLVNITERVSGSLTIKILQEDREFVSETLFLTILAFDEWSGKATAPEMIAAFVTPNHPQIAKVVRRASDILGKWTGNSSLDAYQTNDPNRARLQVAAVYSALKSQNITYCVPPASFETGGQRVRLCDTVLNQKLGTCLDLTLLFASCLEAIGINPMVVLMVDHAFLGAWLCNENFPESVQDDMSLLTKRVADGENKICAVETTAVASGNSFSFEEVEHAAVQHFSELDKFLYFVDIGRARASGIKPLPMRIAKEMGFQIKEEKVDLSSRPSEAPQQLNMMSAVPEENHISITKREVWERKLLDLSLRNNLLNFRPLRNNIHILSSHLDQLEDALASGNDFQILERPLDWEDTIRDAKLFESQNKFSPMGPLLVKEFEQKRLRSDLSSSELNLQLKNLYRKSQDAMEENGANVLYLALGFLKWYETDISQKPHYAPIVLLPVEIIRKCSRSGFIIRERDDEPQINITLLEMLKQDFGIQISGLDPLPMDEHGVNIKLVFHILRQAVMARPRCDIFEDSYLGIFSFSRFVMWNDLRNRSDDLAKNKVVKSLMTGKLEFKQEPLLPQGKELDEICLPNEIILAAGADTSQLGAVYASAQEKSFVLHGPPGTGKSQTITNIIFNELARGKTVLFVAEKMAALSVVQKRLEGMGLGAFCLELHSNKATKKAVLDQLRTATEVSKTNSPGEFQAEAERLQKEREELNNYVKALYRVQPFGLTLYDAITRYFQFEKSNDAVVFEPSIFSDMTKAKLQSWSDMASELNIAGTDTGHPHNHPLLEIKLTEYSQEVKKQAQLLLNDLKTWAEKCDSLAGKIINTLQINNSFHLIQDYQMLAKLTGLITSATDIPQPMLEVDDLSSLVVQIKVVCSHGQEEQKLRRKLLSRFSSDILLYDAQNTLNEWNILETKWFLPRSLGENRILKSLRALSQGNPPQKQEIPFIFTDIITHSKEKSAIEIIEEKIVPIAGKYWNKFDTDWNKILESCSLAEKFDELILFLTHDRQKTLIARRVLSNLLFSDRQLETLRSYETALDHVLDSMNQLGELLLIDFSAIKVGDGFFFTEISGKCIQWEQHLNGLREWCIWVQTKTKAQNFGLSPLVHAYESEAVPNNEVFSAYRKGLYKACVSYILKKENTLSGFSGNLFEEKIRQYRRTAETLRELARQETLARLAAKIPDFSMEAAQSSEVGILKRAIHSNGRGTSIRRLFGQIPRLLPRLCPCILMSPISVSQYLDPQYKIFDLVIFDEASQVPTSEAVGAIARGENVVIVGDPKQLPPTSFFTTDTTDENNLESEDLESILDDCLALSMPETHLLWHYRSQHESLITFSNIEYYENNLYTFPSPNNLVSKVKLVPVEGFYDRGKTKQNVAEAQAVVSDIFNRLKNPESAKHSIGVVTFNSAQQNIIDDLLTEAFTKHPDLEEIAQKCYEPIFVKNLENVQGDERDVILFSIGYGPDQEGRVCHNFGPLNQAGGWRRLNVAVSRAREEMTVYSTLKPEQLDLSRTHAEGVAGLKAFLEFAQRGLTAFAYKGRQLQSPDYGLNEQIAVELKKVGFCVQTNIGSSNYKIDVAIVHPDKKDEFILGILCNGQNYRDAKTASDREILQQKVLKQLGWNIYTVWALDWWDNSDKELQKIKNQVEQLLKTTPEFKPKVETFQPQKPVIASTIPMIKNQQEEDLQTGKVKQFYVVMKLPVENISSDVFCLPEYTQNILDKIAKVIDTEGPISRSLLSKRILQSYSIARMGSRLEKRFDGLLRKVHYPTTTHRRMKYYWPMEIVPSSYKVFRVSENESERRNVEDLPPEEVACAVRYILQNQLSMSKDDLVREASKILGYARAGTTVEQAMLDGISYAERIGAISIDAQNVVFYID
jgi:superfamily I DNA and/or RNA helicase